MSTELQGHGTGVEPSGQFGVFIFLASEGMLFGALILAYLGARIENAPSFVAGSHELSLPLGTANTVVLLTSSLGAALATIWSDAKRPRPARLALGVTALLGLAFLAIKGLEYSDESRRNLLPVPDIALRDPFHQVEATRVFFDAYLALTGTHALHLVTGIVLMAGLALFWRRLRNPGHVVQLAALYWHFIDLVWVFLFPLLYLVR
jgi:cytochrome c oxidase subunit 3